MGSMPRVVSGDERSDDAGTRALTLSWLSVLLLPVGFALAFVVGQGISRALGYPAGGQTPPGWLVWASSVPAVLAFLAPCAGALVYGRRAVRCGRRSGALAALIGGVLGGSWLLVSLVAAATA